MGIFEANERKKANHNQHCSSNVKGHVNKYSKFKVPVI
jgi:hypothetical protein